MVMLYDLVIDDERERLYDAFMSDVLAIGGDIASVAEIGRRLRSALESDCDRRLWASVDDKLASLLACAAVQPHHAALSRLHSYLRENRNGA